MLTIIKKKMKKEKIIKLLISAGNKAKHLKVSKYYRKLKMKENPIIIQKRLRNEWE